MKVIKEEKEIKTYQTEYKIDEYCCKDMKKYLWVNGCMQNSSGLFTRKNTFNITTHFCDSVDQENCCDTSESARINYCPFCGKKIE